MTRSAARCARQTYILRKEARGGALEEKRAPPPLCVRWFVQSAQNKNAAPLKGLSYDPVLTATKLKP